MRVSEGMIIKRAYTLKEESIPDSTKVNTESVYITGNGKMWYVKDFNSLSLINYNNKLNSGEEISAVGNKYIYSYYETDEKWVREDLKKGTGTRYEFNQVRGNDRAKYLKYFI